jgi:phenylacetic acid degradation operon negative regulatory protein
VSDEEDGRRAGELPRTQAGASPQHLIVTLLGDYWSGRREHLPSAGLVALVGEFGITPTSARAALSRLARRGLLDSSRWGRHTFYGLTRDAEQMLGDGLRRIMSFGIEDRPWDGSWVVVAFSVPEEQRDLRHVVRTQLRWQGFAPLYDGVWVSPRADVNATAKLLDELSSVSATILVSHVAHTISAGDPLRAWDLGGLRQAYDDYIAEFSPLLDRVMRGTVGAAEALVARTRVMDAWRRFPDVDPDLPEDVLPEHWPRRRAQHVFAGVYDLLGPIAEVRFQQILAGFAPDLAKRARHHTTAGTR